jgi:curved DNA-binding protein CbpA
LSYTSSAYRWTFLIQSLDSVDIVGKLNFKGKHYVSTGSWLHNKRLLQGATSDKVRHGSLSTDENIVADDYNFRHSSVKEIKDAYRRLAMTLHPDRTEGNTDAAEKFKEVVEAYDTLSNPSKRNVYDQLVFEQSPPRRPPPPNYRKVYAPRPPPNFNPFDPKRHKDMHYGDGIQKEYMEQFLKRAKEASGKKEYQSPIGPGFTFNPKDDHYPFSKNTSKNNHDDKLKYTVNYGEVHFHDVGNTADMAKNHIRFKDQVRHNLHERRRQRISKSQRETNVNRSCTIM